MVLTNKVKTNFRWLFFVILKQKGLSLAMIYSITYHLH